MWRRRVVCLPLGSRTLGHHVHRSEAQGTQMRLGDDRRARSAWSTCTSTCSAPSDNSRPGSGIITNPTVICRRHRSRRRLVSPPMPPYYLRAADFCAPRCFAAVRSMGLVGLPVSGLFGTLQTSGGRAAGFFTSRPTGAGWPVADDYLRRERASRHAASTSARLMAYV